MKIAMFDMQQWDKDNVKTHLKDHDVTMFDEAIQEVDLSKVKDTECVCLFVTSSLGKKDLDKLPNLKLICSMSTGYDKIDLSVCNEREITVCNVPSYGENTVAEHAFALLLAISKKIVPAVERTKKHSFSKDNLEGFDLSGKTMGVIGTGRIGVHAIEMAKGFSMNVIAFDVFQRHDLVNKLGFNYVPLDELIEKSDVITVHVPYNKHTHHLLNSKNMKNMKKGAVLINTARGGVIETKALVETLENGTLKAAGLDVLEGEDLIGTNPSNDEDKEALELCKKIIAMNNVLVTPHSAFETKEALERIENTTCENINSFVKGEPINVI